MIKENSQEKRSEYQKNIVFQANNGLFDVDVVENTFVSYLTLRDQAYQAPNV